MEQNSTVTIPTQNGHLVCASSQLDHFESAALTVSVFGTVRAYGESTVLGAEDIATRYDKDIRALYASIAGQFVVVITDVAQGVTYVVNDHLGSIPFYYCEDEAQILFGPELGVLKAARQQTSEISPQAIFHYCYFHCIPAPTTIYKGISKLCPAELLTIDKQGVKSQGDIYAPHFSQSAVDENEARKQCFVTMENAVAHNLTDNCGAFLSGGLDSSTVSGLLARHRNPARTFSVGFNEPGYDETEYAQITAKQFSTQHEAAYLEPEYITDNFSKVASAFDEPFGNSSALAAFFCASYAKSQGIDTLLAGDGGDELFAGNSRYAKQKLFFPYENAPGFVKSLLKLVFVKSPLAALPGFKKVCSYINQAEDPLPDRLQAYNFLHRFSPQEIFTERFLKGVNTELPLEQLRNRYQSADANSPIDKMLYMDWKFTLADNDLIKVSKMCQMAGVDVRFPLIEKELVDFSCTLPAETKLPGQKLRHFFKKTVEGFLADETLNKSKHGFGLPFGRWMRSTPGLVEITQNALNNLRDRDIVNSEFIDKALKMQSEEHSAYYGELIWILTVLELWLQSRET